MRDHRRHHGSTNSAAGVNQRTGVLPEIWPWSRGVRRRLPSRSLRRGSGHLGRLASSGPPAVPDELIVGFRSGVALGQQEVALQEAGGAATLKRFGQINASLVHTAPGASAGVAKALANDPRVRYAEPNYIVSATVTPNDTRYSELWGMNNTGQTGGTPDADIDAPEAWGIETGSSNVVVDVTDTGVDFSHPDLARNSGSTRARTAARPTRPSCARNGRTASTTTATATSTTTAAGTS